MTADPHGRPPRIPPPIEEPPEIPEGPVRVRLRAPFVANVDGERRAPGDEFDVPGEATASSWFEVV